MVFFIPTSIVAIFINFKNKNIELKTALIVIISGIIGAMIGAKISVNLNVLELKKYFGYFLIIIAINEIYSFIKRPTTAEIRPIKEMPIEKMLFKLKAMPNRQRQMPMSIHFIPFIYGTSLEKYLIYTLYQINLKNAI